MSALTSVPGQDDPNVAQSVDVARRLMATYKTVTRVRDVDSGTSECFTSRVRAGTLDEAKRIARQRAEELRDVLPDARITVSIKQECAS